MHVREATIEEALSIIKDGVANTVVLIAEENSTVYGTIAVSTDGRTMHAHEFLCGEHPYAAVTLWQKVRQLARVLGYPFVTLDVFEDENMYPDLIAKGKMRKMHIAYEIGGRKVRRLCGVVGGAK